MSEPLTPDQEAIGLVEHARYIAECLYLEEIPDDADFNCRDIYDRLAPVADLIRTLAARNAELETDVNMATTAHQEAIQMYVNACEDLGKQDSRIRELEAANAMLTAPLRPEYLQEQTAILKRLAELEEAARWRSCETEPPDSGEDRFYLCRDVHGKTTKFYEYSVRYFSGVNWDGPEPGEWKPIV